MNAESEHKAELRLRLPPARLAVLMSAAGLFLVWLIANFRVLTGTQNGLLRFVLTVVFSLLILWRPKPKRPAGNVRPWQVALCAAAGVAGVGGGLVFSVHQFEWLGILLVLLACLLWALPSACSIDAVRALFLLYWAHPLPARVFGPMQLALQKMSIRGSEWLLHLGNVRVWADGFVLRTGYADYGVPEWCSGMLTATTVFLLVLGLGILRHMNWRETAVLVVIGLLQALALNVLRIAAMVVFVHGGSEGSEVRFLHDAGGVIVMAAVLLVNLELLLWDRSKAARASRKDDHPPGLVPAITVNPPFWRIVLRRKSAGAAALAGLLLAAGAAYKSRPAHRVAMIRDVASGLRDAGKLEEAGRAAQIVTKAFPNDLEWTLTVLRLDLLRGRYAEALTGLAAYDRAAGGADTQTDILRAYALMGLGRMPEAAARVEKLPADVKHRDPRVAIILAEWGYHAGDPDKVSEFIAPASRMESNVERVRALYPYLRAHRRWHAIADSSTEEPYADLGLALVAMEAFMNLNRPADVADLARAAEIAWPTDPRVLEPLFFLASRRGPGEWERHFEAHLARSVLAGNSPDALYRALGKCFDLARPDLAWRVYRRVEALDPAHPALAMSVVRYGRQWFVFRRRYLGLAAQSDDELADMKAAYRIAGRLPQWRTLRDWIPLGGELSKTNTVAARKAHLKAALAEFERRAAAGSLSLDFQYEYVHALDIAERPDQARALLAEIGEQHPEQKAGNRVLLSAIYERRADWQNVYETLRDYLSTSPQPLPEPVFRLCRATLNLRMGVAAVQAARQAARLFPDSGQAALCLVSALSEYDSREEALAVLSRPRAWRERRLDLLEAQALFITQRYGEAQSFCRSVLLSPLKDLSRSPQRLVLPPAELARFWHRIALPSGRDFARNAGTLQTNLKTATSPFLRAMMTLWLQCYDAGCSGEAADPARWVACGRDPSEQALALNQLTMLLCWQDKLAEARRAADMAVNLMPESPSLWRAAIGLSGGDPAVTAAARRACPSDSEIWLADLVGRTQTGPAASAGAGSAAVDESAVEQAILAEAAKNEITPAAMTRAGEYLLRIGMKKAAAAAVRSAVPRARGLLPAYVLGVRCAMEERDKPWAIECTRQAVESSVSPPAFFYAKLVQLKTSEESIVPDNELAEALKNLRRMEPDKALWAQMLGYLSFARGGADRIRSLAEMTAALEKGATNKTPYLIGGESARYLGNLDQAADLLRQGLQRHPADLPMLNNLAFVLASRESTAAEALPLVPVLLERGRDDVRVLDTVAAIYLATGQLAKAEDIVAGILRKAAEGSEPWFRARVVQARIALRRDKPEEAKRILKRALNQSEGVSDEDMLAATALMAEVTEKTTRPPSRRGTNQPSAFMP